MFEICVLIFVIILGAVMGSFACCQAWRIRLKEEGKKDPGKRSVCIACGKKLKWFENIPILSWLIQKGKCRKCGTAIGRAEILAEILGAVSFGVIGWNYLCVIPEEVGPLEMLATINLPAMVAAMAAMVGLILLAVYDGKWGEMPVSILIYTVVMSGVYAAFDFTEIWSLVGGVAILSGTYYLLYFLSKEKLVGGGDWILCLAIGFLLADWRLALVELCLSNLLGSIVMLPKRKKKMAFGPFLVVAFVIIFATKGWLLSTLAMEL
ncbi:prepilin peptidase [Candidatus Saccharibacteria bacterium]|nr:prepilin peptidase [Candidatus Saccharibacteria bacterium]